MKALVKAAFDPNPLIVKETYETLKKRLVDSAMFFEVTSMDGKITLNKTSVEAVIAVSPDVVAKAVNTAKMKKGAAAHEPKQTVIPDKE